MKESTILMRSHPGMVEEIIAMLKHIDIDGETMQFILETVGMDLQMLRQLMLILPIEHVEYLLEERNELFKLSC